MSDDKDDKDDEYDSVFFMMGMHKIWAALIKEKGVDFTQTSSDDEDDKDDDLIAPYTFQIIRPHKCTHQTQIPLLKPVCRFVSLFQRNRKSTRLRGIKV